jgi:hypothetical protein
MLMLVAPNALAIEEIMADKPKTKTILAGPGVRPSTIGTLKKLVTEKTKIKKFGIRTTLGKGISLSAGYRQRDTGKAQPGILGGSRGLSPERGRVPKLEFKIKF